MVRWREELGQFGKERRVGRWGRVEDRRGGDGLDRREREGEMGVLMLRGRVRGEVVVEGRLEKRRLGIGRSGRLRGDT